jgi:7-carboxy-7-deazaguanine synthase
VARGPAWQFKFVVAQPADVEELEGMLASLRRDIPPHKVLLMPEGVTPEAIRARAGWLGELCKARGYRYAHRLHLDLYGNARHLRGKRQRAKTPAQEWLR